MNKQIKEMTIDELEKIELSLWRQREQATAMLHQANNDLQIITNEIVFRNKPKEDEPQNPIIQ